MLGFHEGARQQGGDVDEKLKMGNTTLTANRNRRLEWGRAIHAIGSRQTDRRWHFWQTGLLTSRSPRSRWQIKSQVSSAHGKNLVVAVGADADLNRFLGMSLDVTDFSWLVSAGRAEGCSEKRKCLRCSRGFGCGDERNQPRMNLGEAAAGEWDH